MELTAKSQAMSLHAWRAVAEGDRAPSLAEQFSLDRSGYHLRASRDVGSIMLDDPAGFLGVVGANAVQLAETTVEPSTTPYPNWSLLPPLLLLLAGFAVWRYRHDRVVLTTLAAIAVPVVTVLTYFVQDRYLIASAALGVHARRSRRARAAPAVGRRRGRHHARAPRGLDRHRPLQPDRGLVPSERAQPRAPAGRSVDRPPLRCRRPRHGHEPGCRLLRGTATSSRSPTRPGRVVAFGRHYGVRYLVVDRANTVRYRPQLAPLLAGRPGPGLHAVYGGGARNPSTVVYELVPRPPTFRGSVPRLDHVGEGS